MTRSDPMPIDLAFTIFVLAILCGVAVISKVPATLHTPLMSGANSIHGIVLVGAMIIAVAADNPLSYLLSFLAVAFATLNVVGGYVVTDRMLQMFRRKPAAPKAREGGGLTVDLTILDPIVRLAWLAGAVAFVIGLQPDELAGHRARRATWSRPAAWSSPSAPPWSTCWSGRRPARSTPSAG